MKPETIEIMGVYVSKLVLRVHVMRGGNIYDQGLGFRYWEAALRCTTVDFQQHSSKEKAFQDLRCDLGYFETNNFFGVEKKKVLSLGLPQPEVDDSDSISVSSSSPTGKKSKERACWPSTAATLLQVPALAEAADFESRERHGMQLRFFSLGGTDSDFARTTLNARLGVFHAEFPDTFPDEVQTMIAETTTSIFGEKDKSTDTQPPPATHSTVISVKRKVVPPPSLLKYAIRLDGGQFLWSPLVTVRLPVLRLGGEQSSDSELFFETVLNHVKVQYGKRSMLEKPQSELSLSHMAQLPEDVRMRILFCLKDLGPLEKALGIKRESNSFLRTRAVNKAIVKVAKRSSTKAAKRKKSNKLPHDPKLSRQDILNELKKLDEQALSEIWMAHKNRSSKPKGAKIKRIDHK